MQRRTFTTCCTVFTDTFVGVAALVRRRLTPAKTGLPSSSLSSMTITCRSAQSRFRYTHAWHPVASVVYPAVKRLVRVVLRHAMPSAAQYEHFRALVWRGA